LDKLSAVAILPTQSLKHQDVKVTESIRIQNVCPHQQRHGLLTHTNTDVFRTFVSVTLSFKMWIHVQLSVHTKLTFRHTVRLQVCNELLSRSQWTRGLRRKSSAARLLRSWVRIRQTAWMFVCCECCVLSGRGLCDELITRPEESYQLWCVVVCYLETS